MAPDEPVFASADNPALAALARAPEPAIAVDAGGAVVWTNEAGRLLLTPSGFDAAARSAVTRIAASGAEGLARLRVGTGDRLEALTFRSGKLRIGGVRAVLIQALAPLKLQAETAAAEIPLPESPAKPATAEITLPSSDDPPDPRRLIASHRADEPVPEAAEDDGAAAPAPAPLDVDATPDEEMIPVETAERGDLRFVFEIDAEGRLVFLSPDLAEAVGDSARDAVGRLWSELAEDLALDPQGVVAERLKATTAWSDVPVAWPLADGSRLPLLLSGLPMFDRGRTFLGMRGLGRTAPSTPPVEPSGEDAAPESAPDAVAALDDGLGVAEDPSERKPEAAGGVELESPEHETPEPDIDIAAEPPLDGEPPPLFAAPDEPERFTGNVVALRENALAPARPPAGLSLVEESAFDEIARRLADLRDRDAASWPALEAHDIVAVRSPDELAWAADEALGEGPAAALAEDLMRLMDKLPVGVLVLSEGVIAHASRRALEMLGHADLRQLAARGADDLFADPLPRGDAAPSTLRVVARDGSELDVEARLDSILWRGVSATLVSLKRAEAAASAPHAAEKREKELSEILDTATDGVMTLDQMGRVLSVNRSGEALFGFQAKEAIGRLFTLSLAPESRRAAFDYFDSLRGEGGVASLMNDGREVLGLAHRGGAIPLYLTIGRVGAPEDGRFCAVLRDVTHWKKAEEELLAAKRQAERANAQKSEFLARVSREIRAPLNAIIGFAEVMMEERFGPVGSPRYKDYLRDIHQSGGHLIGLVNDLLDLARIESGRLKLEVAPLDLNELVAQAAALQQPQANRDHVIIRTSLGRNLPAVMADARSVRQILANLLTNAVTLSRPGGQVIVATALSDLGQAVVRVRDAGVGMTRKQVALAMEPFRPLQDADEAAGAGLGLSLTKALAEANEASFTIQSEIGEGTLIEITFSASRIPAS